MHKKLVCRVYVALLRKYGRMYDNGQMRRGDALLCIIRRMRPLHNKAHGVG